MASGIVATIGGLVLVNSEWTAAYPWAMPGLIANGFIMIENEITYGCF